MTDTAVKAPKAKSKKPMTILFITLGVIIIAIIIGTVHSNRYPSTDDTYVNANIINVAPQVGGLVQTVFVKNHQFVKKGQPLVQIDPRPYEYAVSEADAQLKLAEEQGVRTFPLIKSGQAAPATGDQIKADIEQYSAELKQAQYNLEHTLIAAPADGIIANFSTRVGDTLVQDTPIFSLVEQNEFWVAANFKETQLERIRVGQTAEIKVDMYPNYIFKGVVDSISPGAGTVFSLLPAENATGNWVKVTQRVPVKIIITNPDPRYPLIAGTSATAIIDTVHTPNGQ